ncbi:MAG: hemolysin family protein [Solirubrobacteraceae bacterium]|nr:hemolysin family protein [Patulibacter sp.]
MPWLLILVGLLLVLVCGAFVAAEFAMITVDRPTLERAAETGDKRAIGALEAVHHLSTQLSGAQVGITITNLAIGFLAEPSIADLVDDPLESVGLGSGLANAIAVALALIISTAMTMVFGELVPKNIAIARPLETIRTVERFQRWFTSAVSWPISVFNGTANWILRRFGLEPQEELASARSPQELASLVNRSAEQGTLEEGTADLLERSLAFGDRRADDVMTPRVRMQIIEPQASVNAVYELAKSTGHSRFPVVPEGVDQVIGIVHVKHVVDVDPEDRDRVTVADVMAEPMIVPSTLELDHLLEMLREGRLQIAVVVDEFGGVDGVVTMEDLIEELVGDVVDEHDNADASARQLPDGSWDLSGLLRPDEASDVIGVELPEDEDYETLAGLLTLHLEQVPEEGDTVTFTIERFEAPDVEVTLTATEMHGLRVDRVHLSFEELPEPEPEEERGWRHERRSEPRDEEGER